MILQYIIVINTACVAKCMGYYISHMVTTISVLPTGIWVWAFVSPFKHTYIPNFSCVYWIKALNIEIFISISVSCINSSQLLCILWELDVLPLNIIYTLMMNTFEIYKYTYVYVYFYWTNIFFVMKVIGKPIVYDILFKLFIVLKINIRKSISEIFKAESS